MGGNVIIKKHKASPINLKKIDRQGFCQEVLKALDIINQKISLWNPELFKEKTFFSGSSIHLFNNDIPDDEFVKFKALVGDIDLQVDQIYDDKLKDFFDNHQGMIFEGLKLFGYKKSGYQYITLWQCKKYNINIQMDFEMVEFKDGYPTEWARFSHNSAWGDIKLGIKGVAHKYLYRALLAKDLEEITVEMKSGKQKKILSAHMAFSNKGIRPKTQMIQSNPKVFKILDSKDTGFNTNLKDIYNHFFKQSVEYYPLIGEMYSFNGTIDLILNSFTQDEMQKIVEGFVNTLWGQGSQVLYRDNLQRDKEEKECMVKLLCQRLSVKDNFDLIKENYYKKQEMKTNESNRNSS